MVTANPAWVNRSLYKHWNALERLVGPEWMPMQSDTGGIHKHMQLEELGTGSYGTVITTHAPDIVMKVTSDPTEATFVAAALSIGQMPDGIVRYHRIVALPEKLRNRPVFVLWREEAIDVGVELRSEQHPFDGRKYLDGEGLRLIAIFKGAADLLRKQKTRHFPPRSTGNARELAYEYASQVMDDPNTRGYRWHEAQWFIKRRVEHLRGTLRADVLYEIVDWCFDMMENTHGVHEVGGAMRFYFERAILLADVHDKNIGRVKREDWSHPENVITDPGHAVFLDDRYDGVVIPSLEDAVDTKSAKEALADPRRLSQEEFDHQLGR